MKPYTKPLIAQVLELLLLPALVGLATGSIVGVVGYLIEDKLLHSLEGQTALWVGLVPFLILPLTYLVMKWIVRTFHPSTSEVYIVAYFSRKKTFSVRQVPGRLLAGITTVACGGSQGLESPSALVGAGIGTVFERSLKPILSFKNNRGLLMTVGASAGIAAIFSSPITGAFYGVEVPFVRKFDLRASIPAFIAATFSYAMDVLIRGPRPLVPITYAACTTWFDALAVMLLGLICGLGAKIFCTLLSWGRSRALNCSIGARFCILGLALAILALTSHLCFGRWITFGPGYGTSNFAFASPHTWYVVLAIMALHTIATIICVWGAAGGGVFTSLALAGGLLGLSLGILMGYPDGGIFPIIGAACFLGAGYHIPLAGVGLITWGCSDLSVVMVGILAVMISFWIVGKQTVATARKDD